jgi:carbon-monoxide dehydrogenase medium subunit
MKPPPFAYKRVRTIDEAAQQLFEYGDEAKVISGGQSLVPMMNLRLARPRALIDINDLPGLDFIVAENTGVRIGALTRHIQLERYPIVLDRFAVIQQAAPLVGHYPIRTRGTFGGSIAHADPSAEWPLLATLLDAEIVVEGRDGQRTVRASEFYRGFLTTVLEPDEIVVEVRFSNGADHTGISEFARRQGDFAIVVAAVAFDVRDGLCRGVRIALGGVSDRPVRVAEAEQALEGAEPTELAFTTAGEAAAQSIDPPEDIHGTSEYRRFLTVGLVERSLQQAFKGDNVKGGQDV